MAKKKLTSRDDLLARCKRRYNTVSIDGMQFRLQSLSEAEKSRFEKQVINKKTGEVYMSARRRLLITMLVDEDDNPLLSGSDLDLLGEMDGAIVGKLFDAASEHAGFGSAEAVEELEKNCSDIQDAILVSN
jgi:hypothetical protein